MDKFIDPLAISTDQRTKEVLNRGDFTLEYLKEILEYNPLTGIFTWKVDKGGRVRKGDKAGFLNKAIGREYITLGYKQYLISKLAWFYMTGEWPDKTIDHEDRNPKNNKWINLRQATGAQQNANKGIDHRNRSGVKGVYWIEMDQCWRAEIQIKGKYIWSKQSKNKEEVIEARRIKAEEVWGKDFYIEK